MQEGLVVGLPSFVTVKVSKVVILKFESHFCVVRIFLGHMQFEVHLANFFLCEVSSFVAEKFCVDYFFSRSKGKRAL